MTPDRFVRRDLPAVLSTIAATAMMVGNHPFWWLLAPALLAGTWWLVTGPLLQTVAQQQRFDWFSFVLAGLISAVLFACFGAIYTILDIVGSSFR